MKQIINLSRNFSNSDNTKLSMATTEYLSLGFAAGPDHRVLLLLLLILSNQGYAVC